MGGGFPGLTAPNSLHVLGGNSDPPRASHSSGPFWRLHIILLNLLFKNGELLKNFGQVFFCVLWLACPFRTPESTPPLVPPQKRDRLQREREQKRAQEAEREAALELQRQKKSRPPTLNVVIGVYWRIKSVSDLSSISVDPTQRHNRLTLSILFLQP